MKNKMTNEIRSEDIERAMKIAPLLYYAPKNMEQALPSAERTGLLYIVQNTAGKEILPIRACNSYDYDEDSHENFWHGASYTVQNNMRKVFSEKIKFCDKELRNAYRAAVNVNPCMNTGLTSLGAVPTGDVAFVGEGMCICGNGQSLDYRAIPEVTKYGEIFCQVALDGESHNWTIKALGLQDSSNESIQNLFALPSKQRVREFTQRFLRNENLMAEQLTRVHLIPAFAYEDHNFAQFFRNL